MKAGNGEEHRIVTETTEAPAFRFFDGVAEILRSTAENSGRLSLVELTMPRPALASA